MNDVEYYLSSALDENDVEASTHLQLDIEVTDSDSRDILEKICLMYKPNLLFILSQHKDIRLLLKKHNLKDLKKMVNLNSGRLVEEPKRICNMLDLLYASTL